MVTGAGKKWLIGCGVAAGLLAILVVAITWGGVALFRKAARGIEDMEASSREVSRRFGSPDQFVPAPDGILAADRVEAFLKAREILSPYRDELGDALGALDGEGGNKLSAGVRLVPGIFRFYKSRNDACLEAGIGPGEYGYLYILSFYGFLQKPVTAGPGFPLTGDSRDGGAGPGYTAFDVREDRQERILSAARDLALPLLRNQLEALERSGAEPAWRDRLKAEIGLLEADPFRLPWRDGLPRRIAGSLEPYRDRLEASWNDRVNPLEIGFPVH